MSDVIPFPKSLLPKVRLKTPINAGDKWIAAGTVCEVCRQTELFLDVRAEGVEFWIHRLEADSL